MTKETVLRNQIKQHVDALKELHNELNTVLPNKQYSCSRCSRRSRIKNVSIVKRMAYREPLSCTGGDYWYFTEFLIVCPKCGVYDRGFPDYRAENSEFSALQAENSSETSGWWKRCAELNEFITEYYHYFKEVIEWYPKTDDILNLKQVRKKHYERNAVDNLYG